MKKMHILIIPSFYPVKENNVSGIFFKEQAMALKKRGIRVGIVYSEKRSIKKISIKGFLNNHYQSKVYVEDGIVTWRNHGWNIIPERTRLGATRWVKKTLKLVRKYINQQGKPDIIHAHCSLWAGYAAFLISKKYKIPYIITEHSSAFLNETITKWQRRFVYDSFKNASAIISVSGALAQKLYDFVSDKSREILVIPNLIDVNFFTLPEERNDSQSFNFISIGGLNDNKGFDILIKAFAYAFKGKEHIFLKIGGDGKIKNRLVQLCKELGIEKQVIFKGKISREEVRQLMWDGGAFVLASNVETFGVVLIEALATGLPVIATRSGGPEDIVNEEVGLLAQKGDFKDLAEKMQKIYETRAVYDEKKLRLYIEKNYSEEVVTTKLIKIYKGILKGES